MAVEIKVPDMGESVIEATVSRWMKQEGEAVAAGEPVVELETDKINLEVGAQQPGVIQRILHPAGDTVSVGDVLAVVDPGGSVAPVGATVAATGTAAQQDSAAEVVSAKNAAAEGIPGGEKLTEQELPERGYGGEERTPAEAAGKAAAPGTEATGATSAGAQVTPVAQRMAQDLGVDLNRVTGSGPGGRITKEDVQAAAAVKPPAEAGRSPAAAAQPAEQAPAQAPIRPDGREQPEAGMAAPGTATRSLPGRETRVRMSRRRQTIARRLVEAQHAAAMLTTFNEIDISAVMDLRKRRREGFKERYGVDLGFMSFFVKASIGALKAFPQVNAELQGDELVLKHYYDIGVAIGAEEGLVVPVIRNADALNFAGIEKAIKDFVTKVKDNSLTLEDLRGGTFTITNGGVYGSLMSTPILNPPQVAILGMHAIKERPVVVDHQVVVRPMMYVALSYDHRVVDGREAVQFLVRIKELVEDPEALLFG